MKSWQRPASSTQSLPAGCMLRVGGARRRSLCAFAFVLTALSGTPGAAAGAESLVSGSTSLLFWGGAVGCGLLIPCITACLKSLPSAALGGAAALIGALSLRAAILFAGTFDPVIWPL